jgi:hypothetical protein
MKLETFVSAKSQPRRKRGPRPEPRFTEFGASYLRLRMALESIDFYDVSGLAGLSEPQVKNVLRRARGPAPEARQRILDALVSPFNDHNSTLSPTQLTWFERLRYPSLLSTAPSRPTAAPQSYVVLDKSVWTGKLTMRQRVISRPEDLPRHVTFRRKSELLHFCLRS